MPDAVGGQAETMGLQVTEERATARGGARLIALVGALGVAVAAVLPWVTVRGLPLDLGLLDVKVSGGAGVEQTVHGSDTAAWPVLLGLAGLVALLAILGRLRRLLLALGVLTALGGGGLLYYLWNVVEIETSERSALERLVADVAVSTSVGPGPYVLIGAGVAIALGGLRSRGSR